MSLLVGRRWERRKAKADREIREEKHEQATTVL